MIPLTLPWMLLIASLSTSVGGQHQDPSLTLQQESVEVRYPKNLSIEAIDCDCTDVNCDLVHWFHSNPNHQKVQFIGQCNSANRVSHGDGVDAERFKMSKKSTMTFTLRIINITMEDSGFYSCVLKDRKKNTEMWKSGVLLLPGVNPPTVPEKTKPKPTVSSACHCSEGNSSQDGCGSLILWPLVGIIATLALTLICVMYYFSRLPKKCRHHFVKKR